MKRKSASKALTGLALAIALAAGASTAHATHAWGNYHWARTSNPFTLKLGDNVSSVWDRYLATTSSDWSVSTVLDTTIVAGGATRPKTCRATAGHVEVCNTTYGNTGWLGVASIWANGNHITQGTVKLNDTYFNTATYNKPEWRNLVMCQEVGHTFGLAHQDENFSNPNLNTCMDYTNDPVSNQSPNQHDYEELNLIYSHLDSTTTIGAALPSGTPPAMTQADFSGPAQWGRLVAEYRNGRFQIYELDFGGGHKILTHVFWAIGNERGRGIER